MTQKQIAMFINGSVEGQHIEEWDLTHRLSELCDELENGKLDVDEFTYAVNDAFREANFATTLTETIISEFIDAQ